LETTWKTGNYANYRDFRIFPKPCILSTLHIINSRIFQNKTKMKYSTTVRAPKKQRRLEQLRTIRSRVKRRLQFPESCPQTKKPRPKTEPCELKYNTTYLSDLFALPGASKTKCNGNAEDLQSVNSYNVERHEIPDLGHFPINYTALGFMLHSLNIDNTVSRNF